MKNSFNIGIIGSGNIGGTLGKHFAKAGHKVMFSSRNPENLTELIEEAGDNASAGSIEQAFDFGEIVLFAFPFGKVPEVAKKVNRTKSKIIIDANNYYPYRDGDLPKEEMDKNGWLESEWTASYFPESHLIKAFNTVYFKRLEAKAFDLSNPLGIVFTASDEIGKQKLEALLESIGFQGLYLGDLSQSKITQPDEKLYNLESLTISQLKELL